MNFMDFMTGDNLLVEIVGEKRQIPLIDYLSGDYYISGISTRKQAAGISSGEWDLRRQPKPFISNARFNLIERVESWQRLYSMPNRRISCHSFYCLLCSLEVVAASLYFSPGIIDYCLSKTTSGRPLSGDLLELKDFWVNDLKRQRIAVAAEIESQRRGEYLEQGTDVITYNPDYHLRGLLMALKFGMTKESWDAFNAGIKSKGIDGFLKRLKSPVKAVSTTLPPDSMWLEILNWLQQIEEETVICPDAVEYIN